MEMHNKPYEKIEKDGRCLRSFDGHHFAFVSEDQSEQVER